jgi:hypothetical protein
MLYVAACDPAPSTTRSDLSPIENPSCAGQPLGTTETRVRYREAVVAADAQCESETQTRSCGADALFSPWSGTFAFASCAIGMALDCAQTPNGGEEQRIRFATATVPFGDNCVSEVQTRRCENGQLTNWTGSYTVESCTVTPAAACGSVAHGASETRTRFRAESVVAPAVCESETQTRVCTNGTFAPWSGSYTFLTCAVVNVIAVNRLTDPVAAQVAPDCTLRDAVRAANSNAAVAGCAAGTTGIDRIVLPIGTIVLNRSAASGEDNAVSGDLDLLPAGGSVEIVGQGRDQSVIDAATLGDRIFEVVAAATPITVRIEAVTLRNARARAGQDGGAIRSLGHRLVVQTCRLTRNETADGAGGAIYVEGGSALVSDSLLLQNRTGDGSPTTSAPRPGGAILFEGTELAVKNSTFDRNRTGNAVGAGRKGAAGGAVWARPTVRLDVEGSTFTDNQAGNGASANPPGNGGDGGAIAIDVTNMNSETATLRLHNSSFSSNRSGNGGTAASGPPTAFSGRGGALCLSAWLRGAIPPMWTFSQLRFTQNAAGTGPAGAYGGAMWVESFSTVPPFVIEQSTFDRNSAPLSTGVYGALGVQSGTLAPNPFVIRECLFTGNSAPTHGAVGASLIPGTILNSTFDANLGGGLFLREAGSKVLFSTITGHIVGGPALQGGLGPIGIIGSVINGNAPPQCSGPPPTTSHSYLPTECGTSALTGDAQLAGLADNGGPTQTRLPSAISVLRGAVPAASCIDEAGRPLTRDQRGQARPNPVGSPCDVGAVERD